MAFILDFDSLMELLLDVFFGLLLEMFLLLYITFRGPNLQLLSAIITANCQLIITKKEKN